MHAALSALAHAGVQLDDRDDHLLDAKLSRALAAALPPGVDDDGPRGATLVVRAHITREDRHGVVFPEHVMNTYALTWQVSLRTSGGALLVPLHAGGEHVAAISPETAWKGFSLHHDVVHELVDALLDELERGPPAPPTPHENDESRGISL